MILKVNKNNKIQINKKYKKNKINSKSYKISNLTIHQKFLIIQMNQRKQKYLTKNKISQKGQAAEIKIKNKVMMIKKTQITIQNLKKKMMENYKIKF